MPLSLRRIILTAALTAGAAVAVSAPASAYVVCNREGDCWHVDQRYRYNPAVGAVYHNDDWYFHQRWQANHERRYRDYHEGRGYWQGGEWHGGDRDDHREHRDDR